MALKILVFDFELFVHGLAEQYRATSDSVWPKVLSFVDGFTIPPGRKCFFVEGLAL
jgi:hypothetical protein